MFVTKTPVAPGVVCVTLNRPDRMNALSMAVVEELLSVLETLSCDSQVAAIVLTGAGRGFCAGGDIKEMEQNRGKTLAQRHADLTQMHLIPQLIAAMPQVVVAAVNGDAYGAGFAVALTCDVVLAANTARFGTAFLKQGLVSDFGLSYQLTHLAGAGAARRIIYTDQVLTAVQAQNLGLVAETHDPAKLLPAAYDLARQIATWPNEARGEMKALLRRAETAPHRDMLEAEAEAQGRMIVSDSHATAVDEFNNRRPTRAD